MKIPYKIKRNHWNLFYALMWGIYAGFGADKNPSKWWFEYVPLFLAICFLLYFIFDKKTYYIKLENGILKQSGLFHKKIIFSEIKKITKTADTYILKTAKTELTINTQLISSEILNELNNELEKLNLE